MLDKHKIEEALTLLGKRLEPENPGTIDIVICGGSSLIITGLISRAFTKDIDIVGLGSRTTDGEFIIKQCKKLPEILYKNIQLIAQDLGLEKNWLNSGPTSLIEFGLPEGLTDRLQFKQYGNVLTVHFISRIDQIYLKLYAAADTGPGRHVNDLIELKPTEEELIPAIAWVFTHDNSEGFKQMVKGLLIEIGYGTIAERI